MCSTKFLPKCSWISHRRDSSSAWWLHGPDKGQGAQILNKSYGKSKLFSLLPYRRGSILSSIVKRKSSHSKIKNDHIYLLTQVPTPGDICWHSCPLTTTLLSCFMNFTDCPKPACHIMSISGSFRVNLFFTHELGVRYFLSVWAPAARPPQMPGIRALTHNPLMWWHLYSSQLVSILYQQLYTFIFLCKHCNLSINNSQA